MPVFKDFSENGELLQIRDEPLNTENLARYIKVNSKERAEGYLEGLEDTLEQIGTTFFETFGEYDRHVGSYHVGCRATKIHTAKVDFLIFAKELLEGMPTVNTKGSDQNDKLDRPLEKRNLASYIQKHGIEKAKGYVDAVDDVTKQIAISFNRVFKDKAEKSPPAYVGSSTEKMHKERNEFLKFAKSYIQSSQSDKPIQQPHIS